MFEKKKITSREDVEELLKEYIDEIHRINKDGETFVVRFLLNMVKYNYLGNDSLSIHQNFAKKVREHLDSEKKTHLFTYDIIETPKDFDGGKFLDIQLYIHP